MNMRIKIYGKEKCPFTKAAREDYEKQGIPFDYIDVLANAEDLEKMLTLSNGQRRVPVIVEGDAVTVGFRGKA
jgi:glutaredoxin